VKPAEWIWANPVLQREWAASRRGTTRLRVLGSRLWLVIAVIIYATAAHRLSREEQNPWEARGLLLSLCVLYLAWMSLALPGPTAGRLSGERERRTWPALLLTALRPSQVVAAKLLASLKGPVAALAQFLPLLMMGAHAGRLPAPRLALIVSVLLVSAAGAGAVSLWLSGRCRHTRTAAPLAYLVIGFWIWGTLAVLPEQFVRGENLWWYLSPAWQVAVLSLVEPGPSPLARPLLPEWCWFLPGCAAVTGLLLVLLTRRIAQCGE
jgi:hypothetical protein